MVIAYENARRLRKWGRLEYYQEAMQKRTREIIALAMLLVLMVAGISFMGWYIKAGHNWNVAATTIDDRFGQMDGYVVVLYKGTDEPKEEPSASTTLPSRRLSEAERAHERELAENTLLEQSRTSYQQKGATVIVLDAQRSAQYQRPSVVICRECKVGVFTVDATTAYLSIDAALNYFAAQEVDYVIALEESTNEYAESVAGIDIVLAVGQRPQDEAAVNGAAPNGRNAAGASAANATATTNASSAATNGGSSANDGSSSGKESTGAASSAASSSSDGAAQSQSDPAFKRSDAFFVDYYERGTIGAILISPNNLVSAKTISE